MNYGGRYFANKTEVVTEIVEDINSHIREINFKLEKLELFDWEEIFEHVPDGDKVKDEIICHIEDMRYEINELIG